MTLAADIAALLAKDALEAAQTAAVEAVRRAPADAGARNLLIDLLILSGDYARADKHCAVAVDLSPDAAIGFARLRGELRGMAARVACFEEGAVPGFPGGPTPRGERALRLLVADRAKDDGEVAALAAALDGPAEALGVTVNGGPAALWRDCDDRTAHVLEAIGAGGAYLWIDFARVAELRIEPMRRPRDLAFRPARVALRDGSAADVLLPAIYHGTPDEPKLRLGRETAWERSAGGLAVGRGLRCFLADDALLPLHELATLKADARTAASPAEPVDG